MTHRDVELLAIGAGPSNLALAVAIEELAPDDLAENTLLIERDETVSWQRGMLLPEAQSQVSFLKDVVTLRNPRSRFSFVNYLHSVGRLSQFINMGSFWPYRIEMSDYFQWVADSLSKVRLECSRQCVGVRPQRAADGTLTGWLAELADGSTIASRYLVLGAGRDPMVAPMFAALPPRRVIHSTQYIPRIAEMPKDVPYRVVVIGGGQSAAEMFDAVQRDLPGCTRTMVMRSIGMKTYENSKFTNELYFPGFVDDFFQARPEAREQILREMHLTNYSGLAAPMLDNIYRQLYLDRMTGKGKLRIITLTDVTGAREDSDEVVLELTDRKTGAVEELRCDLVLLGTGFQSGMPSLVQGLARALGLERVAVTRDYRLVVDGPAAAACYLQGINESTHGIADSLLSVLAPRASDIAHDVLAHRASLAEPGARPDLPEPVGGGTAEDPAAPARPAGLHDNPGGAESSLLASVSVPTT
jgi:L-ornithine N5-oxygenase